MRILVLNYEYPPLGGGAAPVSAELAERYATRGHEVDVVTMGFGDLPRQEERRGVRIFRVPCLRRRKERCSPIEQASYLASAVFFLCRRLRTYSYDVVHVHFLIPTGIVAWWLKRRFGVPYILTMHGSDVPGYNPDRFVFLHRFTRPLLRAVARHAARIVSPSRYLADLFKRRVDARRSMNVEHIPNGVDPSRFVPLPKERIILATGRLLPRKGFQHLIKAVSGTYVGYAVHIAGDGPVMTELRRLAAGSATPVVFHGWMDATSDEYRDLLGRSAVFCLPSERENASVSLLEAMSAGCAVITSTASGCAETVSDTGITVPFGDVAALRDALGRVLEGDTARLMGERARKRVRREFSWDTIIDRYRPWETAVEMHIPGN